MGPTQAKKTGFGNFCYSIGSILLSLRLLNWKMSPQSWYLVSGWEILLKNTVNTEKKRARL